MTASTPEQAYDERRERFAAERDALLRRTRFVAHGRLAAFIAVVLLLLWAELAAPADRAMPLLLAAVSGAAFVALVVYHGRLRAATTWADQHVALAREGTARLARDWRTLDRRHHPPPADHPYAGDLDVFGHASLAALLGGTATPTGAATLRRWLLEPAAAAEVAQRQDAVLELAPLLDLRQGIEARGRLARPVDLASVESFLEWAEREPWLLARPGLLWLSRLLPVATLLLIVLALIGAVDGRLWVLGAAVQLALIWSQHRRISRVYGDAFPADALNEFVPLFATVERASFTAPRLLELQERLHAGGGAARELDRLRRLLHLADVRLSLLSIVVQALVLWDLQMVALLERWKERSGACVRDWLRAMAEVEALAALATVAFDHPGWSRPAVDPAPERPGGSAGFDARGLAHPLLRDGEAVANDVAVGPAGSFLLVTGSNMSGKSTLLRAAGLAAVMAQCGLPVCATDLRMTALRPWTAMRVRDSLERGLSLFMAEVSRLRAVVEAAEAGGPPVLYLLDEILQGTNVDEHRIGAGWVLERLLESPAIGALATHDLALAETPPLDGAARPVHFLETVEELPGGQLDMRFDHRLRPGLAPSRNALVIMRIAGLGPKEMGNGGTAERGEEAGRSRRTEGG